MRMTSTARSRSAACSGGLDDNGNLTALHIRVSGQSINAYLSPTTSRTARTCGSCRALEGAGRRAVRLRDAEPAHRVRDAQHPRAGRAVARRQHQPERRLPRVLHRGMARAAGKDSLEFRRAMLKDHPKHLAVLNAAAEKAGWGKPLPPGVHRGIAQFMGYGSYSAAVAEVSVNGKEVKVHRMVLALNCGHAVNPANRGAGRGLGGLRASTPATARSPSTRGGSSEKNFHTYRVRALARDAEGRDRHRADLRLLGRRGRADDLRGGAGRAERDLRRDRQAGAHAAAQEPEDGVGITSGEKARPWSRAFFCGPRTLIHDH